MAEKEISNIIKLQIEAAKATPAPPVGPALGGSGVNIMQFVKEFNDRTANEAGFIIPVVITVYKDKTFSFITKVPPVAVLIKKAIKIEKGSGKPNKEKVAKITKEQVKAIADSVQDAFTEQGIEPRAKEGYDTQTWILLDYADIIVHVFDEENREFYNLEKLWKDAPYVDVDTLN